MLCILKRCLKLHTADLSGLNGLPLYQETNTKLVEPTGWSLWPSCILCGLSAGHGTAVWSHGRAISSSSMECRAIPGHQGSVVGTPASRSGTQQHKGDPHSGNTAPWREQWGGEWPVHICDMQLIGFMGWGLEWRSRSWEGWRKPTIYSQRWWKQNLLHVLWWHSEAAVAARPLPTHSDQTHTQCQSAGVPRHITPRNAIVHRGSVHQNLGGNGEQV